MCHRHCGLSTYGLKARVREMSILPKLTIGHGQSLPFLKYESNLLDVMHLQYIYTYFNNIVPEAVDTNYCLAPLELGEQTWRRLNHFAGGIR